MSDLNSRRALIAARLRAAREMAGLSQGQVAKLMGLHRPTISEAEAGRRRIPAEELAEFARIYAVSVSWLVGDREKVRDPDSDRVELAARRLSKLRPEDLRQLLHVVEALRGRSHAGSRL